MKTDQSAGIWAIDPIHSAIRFEAKYLLISKVPGRFTDFEGTLVRDAASVNDRSDAAATVPDLFTPVDHFSNSTIRIAIYANSIDTGNRERDDHLRSPDFFDAKHYPVIGFHSSGVTLENDGFYMVKGLLAIRDIVKEHSFRLQHSGTATDPNGNTKAGFTMETVISRNQFDVGWNQSIGADRWLLADEIRLLADIQLLKLSSNP